MRRQTHVSMGQWGMGRSEHLFDDAKEFRPERWLDLEVQKVSGRRVDDILKPFSMGWAGFEIHLESSRHC